MKKVRTIGTLFAAATATTTIFSISLCGCSNNKNEQIVVFEFGEKKDSTGADRKCLYSKDMSFDIYHTYTLTFSFEKWQDLSDTEGKHLSFWVWDKNATGIQQWTLPQVVGGEKHHIYWNTPNVEEILNQVSLPTKENPGFHYFDDTLFVRGGSNLTNSSTISFTFQVIRNIEIGYVGCWFENQ